MAKSKRNINLKKFFLNIIIPTLLSIILFIVLIFWYIIPYFEANLLLSKKEMIRELVNSTISIANKNYTDFKSGKISEEAAKKDAIEKIRSMRYGMEDKDYFFITDMKPNMIMHPYRTELNGKDLSDLQDPNGKALFKEMVVKAELSGEGYVDYQWQWMDDSNKIVPKISYVQQFKPWGWIIGTGIYIEDVKEKILEIEYELILVSIAISVIIAFLLIIIVFQNLKTEYERSKAEAKLLVAKEKYQTLVEASTEGTAMILDGELVYSNKIFDDMFHDKKSKYLGNNLNELINPNNQNDIQKIANFIESPLNYLQLETNILISENSNSSALLSLSKITLSNKDGLILILKELSPDAVSETEKIRWSKILFDLFESINHGMFKISLSENGKFIDLNEKSVQILNYPSKTDLIEVSIFDLVENENDALIFIKKVKNQGFISDIQLKVRKYTGELLTVSIIAKHEFDEADNQEYITGVFSDISEKVSLQSLQDTNYNELESSMNYLNQELKNFKKEIISCQSNLTVHDAASLMRSNNTEYLIVVSIDGEPIGIVTAFDLCTKMIFNEVNNTTEIFKIMSSPICSLSENAILSEAIIKMEENRIHHIAIRNEKSEITGIIGIKEILKSQYNSSHLLLVSIKNADSLEELINIHIRLHFFVISAIESGSKSDYVIRTISMITQAITKRICEIIFQEIGEPPVAFAFISLGSEARNEQTLVTDQDNALIYEDVDDSKLVEVGAYFKRFAERMNFMLNEVGYAYCVGDIMAKNIKWNKPLSVWKKYFRGWISNPEPQNLLEIALFFDMKLSYGNNILFNDLLQYVATQLNDNKAFFGFLARVGVSYKTQLNIFGKIHTESNEEHSNSVNVKNATRVIVYLVRLYAMKYNLLETNTMKRLIILYEMNVFSEQLYKDIAFSYEFLTSLQLKNQVKAISQNSNPDNFIDITNLSNLEVKTLKNIFAQISVFQSKLKYDFGITE